MGKYSEMRRGSNPTSPTYPLVFSGAGRKGRAWDFSAALRATEDDRPGEEKKKRKEMVTKAACLIDVHQECWSKLRRGLVVLIHQLHPEPPGRARSLKLRPRSASGASKMAPKMSLRKFNFFSIFFGNFDEAQVAPWAADMAKVLLFIVNP